MIKNLIIGSLLLILVTQPVKKDKAFELALEIIPKGQKVKISEQTPFVLNKPFVGVYELQTGKEKATVKVTLVREK